MFRRMFSARFERWLLYEVVRAKGRVQALRRKHPDASTGEIASHLIDRKKKMAKRGGAVSGMFGMLSLPADLAFVAYLQLSLIVDLAVLHGRNVKSDRARGEILEILLGANGGARIASRAGAKATLRIAERVVAEQGLGFLGRVVPLIAAPITAALNNRDLERAGEEALRYYSQIPNVLEARKVGMA